MSSPVFVQIAAFNELENLRVLVPELLGLPADYHVLVVDDSSPDGSPDWLRREAARTPRLHALVRPAKLGYASATLDGFRRARELGAERLVTMDADLSHDPRALPELVAGLDEADVVLGSRYAGGCRVLNWALSRLALSVFANWYVRCLLRLPFADTTSGYRAYRMAALAEHLDLSVVSSGGYSVLVELLYRLFRAGARIVEHPIVYSERREGQSKMSRGVILEAAVVPVLLWFRVSPPWPRPRGAVRDSTAARPRR